MEVGAVLSLLDGGVWRVLAGLVELGDERSAGVVWPVRGAKRDEGNAFGCALLAGALRCDAFAGALRCVGSVCGCVRAFGAVAGLVGAVRVAAGLARSFAPTRVAGLAVLPGARAGSGCGLVALLPTTWTRCAGALRFPAVPVVRAAAWRICGFVSG